MVFLSIYVRGGASFKNLGGGGHDMPPLVVIGFTDLLKTGVEPCPPTRPTPFRRPCMYVMAIRVVEFSNGGYKIRKIFA